MFLTQLFFALSALFFTPGPTNTLLALAGAEGGLRRALRLLPAETLGYLAAILPLWGLRLWFDPAAGAFGQYLRVAAALWVLWLAYKLLRDSIGPLTPQGSRIGHRQIFITTLLNPKSLLIALILLPSPQMAGALGGIALLIWLVPLIGAFWCLLGAALRQGAGQGGMVWIKRIGALWLILLALNLGGQSLSALWG